MERCVDYHNLDLSSICPDPRWNSDDTGALKMHSVHVYPAKFPPLVAREAFSYAFEEGVNCKNIADIFCGCGTVALEAKLRGIDFWGCDISPVAVLITRAKTNDYDPNLLQEYHRKVIDLYHSYNNEQQDYYSIAPERLQYWFDKVSFNSLYCLKESIKAAIDISEYQDAFLCIFSSILKNVSRWLQKSIKPQIDQKKKRVDVLTLFENHYDRFEDAVREIKTKICSKQNTIIEYADYQKTKRKKQHDLIITSPPYVTSYEYADLHQLSSLWLDYTDDYKELRKGSIGSISHSREIDIDTLDLNETAAGIIRELKRTKLRVGKIKAIARYYSDIQNVIRKCYGMITDKGMALFVIGDSEIEGVKITNARHLIESLTYNGFSDIKIGKRIIEKGLCVPFRDHAGRFTRSNSSHKEIYREEYIISGRKR